MSHSRALLVPHLRSVRRADAHEKVLPGVAEEHPQRDAEQAQSQGQLTQPSTHISLLFFFKNQYNNSSSTFLIDLTFSINFFFDSQ